MDSPLKHHFDPAERPDCLDVSPERLNPMTAAQLERELEEKTERWMYLTELAEKIENQQ